MKGLPTDRELVRLALKALDPEGVKNRSLKKFTPRKYTSVRYTSICGALMVMIN